MGEQQIVHQSCSIQLFTNLIVYGLVFGIVALFIIVGLFYRYMITSKLISKKQPHNESNNKQNKYYQLTVLLGSGGHTGQLSLMLKNLHFNQLNKLNVLITSNDNSSKTYFQNLLKQQITTHLNNKLTYHKVLRTNQVKQNYISAIRTTLKSIINSIELIRNQLINTTHFVSNGPGTCVPFFFLFFVLNKLRITQTKLIFIESWCRVTSISLSGKIVKLFADKFLVHWQQQKQIYPWTQYEGKIL